MRFLTLQAYVSLLRFNRYLARDNFSGLYNAVRKCPLDGNPPAPDAIQRICSAVDLACIWHWKHVLCLQRSAVATCLLRSYGIPAELVIGAQQMPFKSHAWVEVNGSVVNDKEYIPSIYAILDRW